MKRKIYKLLSSAKQGLFAFVLASIPSLCYSQATYTYNYTGAIQTLNISAGWYQIECWGANGSKYSTPGGAASIGGYSKGIYVATAPITLYIGVGQSKGIQTGGNQGVCYN